MNRPRSEVPKPTKNVTVDAELVREINRIADELTTSLGFRPTISQTIRHLIFAARPKTGDAS